MTPRPIIALTTDFGTGSSYVAQLKGVLLAALPHVCLVDVSHDLPAFSLRHAALFLRGTAFALPRGTVHVVIVDPGVGTARRPIAVAAGGMFFVGPDNGILGVPLAAPGSRCVHLCRPHLFRHPVSSTFHGRDIFAPVAAELAAGLDLLDVGDPIDDPCGSPLPAPVLDATHAHGQTLAADRFGNLASNIPGVQVDQTRPVTVRCGTHEHQVPWVRTYEEAGPGQLVATVGSDGYVELALRQGSAHTYLGSDAALLQCLIRSTE